MKIVIDVINSTLHAEGFNGVSYTEDIERPRSISDAMGYVAKAVKDMAPDWATHWTVAGAVTHKNPGVHWAVVHAGFALIADEDGMNQMWAKLGEHPKI